MYLNPRERARRDLETKHGKNMVKMAEGTANRLNSTLEAQIMNLGVSLGRSSSSILSLSPVRPSSLKKKGLQKMLTSANNLDGSFDRVDEDPLETKSTKFAQETFTNMDLKSSFVSSSPNRRLAHLAEKDAKLIKKISKNKLNIS